MAKRGRPPLTPAERAARLAAKPKPVTRLEKTAANLSSQEAAIRDHIQHLVQVFVEGARKASTPPGVAVMAACEILAFMVHANLPPEQHAGELTRFTDYITSRLAEMPNAHPSSAH